MRATPSALRRTLVTVGLVAAALFSLGLVVRHHLNWSGSPREQALIDSVTESLLDGLRAGRDSATILYPDTLDELVQLHLHTQVRVLVFSSVDMKDPRMSQLAEFPAVESVGFYSCHNASAVAEELTELPQLREVIFETTEVGDDLLDSLAGVSTLEKLHFEQIMPDETVKRLRERLPGVEVSAPYLRSENPRPER